MGYVMRYVVLKYIKELMALLMSFGSNHTSIGLIPLKTLRNDALEGVSLSKALHIIPFQNAECLKKWSFLNDIITDF